MVDKPWITHFLPSIISSCWILSLEALKNNRPGQPVIILSALGQEADRVKGLKMGADDYIVKPFSVRELLARVDAVLRRSTERAPQVEEFDFGTGTASFSRREISYADHTDKEDLSDKESELLHYLVTNSGRAIARDEILLNLRTRIKVFSRPCEVRATWSHHENIKFHQ